MKYLLISVAVVGMLTACGESKMTTSSEEVEQESEVTYYGEHIADPDPMEVAALLEKLEEKDTVRTQVKATIQSVCQKKGCWMVLNNPASEEETVFVRFKDYGFFMPLGSAGQEVVVQGIGYKSVTPVDELRHYAEDEGATAEEVAAITDPKEEYKFLADGVILYNRKN